MFNWFILFFLPDLAQRNVMFCHHILAGLVAAYAAFAPVHMCFSYYSLFWLGVIELSSPSLVVLELLKFLPVLKPLEIPAQFSFAVAFIYTRVYLWVGVSILLFQDCVSWYNQGSSRLFPCIPTPLPSCQARPSSDFLSQCGMSVRR